MVFPDDKLTMSIRFDDAPLYLRMGGMDYMCRRDWIVSRHCNTDFEVHVALSGGYLMDLDSETIPVEAGQAIFIPPGIYHYPHDLKQPFERFGFTFMPSPELAESLLKRGAARISLSQPCLHLCRSILEELGGQQEFQRDCLGGMFTILLSFLLRKLQIGRAQIQDGRRKEAPLRNIYMDRFFSPWPYEFGTERELANQLHISTRQLNRLLQQTYGMSFREKMIKSKMELAAGLLCTTKKPISEIAELSGYTAAPAFYKAFSAYYGVTPAQYRRQHGRQTGP